MPFSVRRFIEAERGSATVGGIFFTMATLSVTGLALDQANAWNVQTHLQVAADAAALAAATQINDFDAARALGIQTADANLKKSGVIGADDFVFGIWDATNMVFTSTDDEEAANAVRVTTDLDKAGGDAVPTYLLKFVGINYWNVNAGTIALAEPSAGAVEEPTSEPGNAFGALNCNMMTVICFGLFFY